MTSSEGELEEPLKEAGNKLLNPPSSIDELVNLLDKAESLLASVEQAPSESMKDALLPSMKALITNELLTHSEMDVKVSVASCITEITRITAPDAPYNDDQMKEIFHLTVAAFEQLPHVSSRCYTKAVSILETVAKIRSCLVMLDLECDSLVVEMFQKFLKGLRSNQPHTVFSAMETIMTLVIDESEEISLDLLVPLLASVNKENETASPSEWRLGKRIITNCAVKLKDCLKEAVQSLGIALDEYSETVASICQSGSDSLEDEHANGYGEHSADDKLEESNSVLPHQVTEGLVLDTVCGTKVGQPVDGTLKSEMSNGTRNDETYKKNKKFSKSLQSCVLAKHSKSIGARSNAEPGRLGSTKAAKSEIERDSVPNKRGRKPNSLMNPDEGYDRTWISPRRKAMIMHRRKSHDGGVDDTPSENPDSSKAKLSLENVAEPSALEAKTYRIIALPAQFPQHLLPGSSHRKRGRPKKNGNAVNQDANPSSLSRSKGRFLNARDGDKALQSADLSVKKESEVLGNCDSKAQGCSRKIRIAAKPKEETTVAPGYLVSEKEAAVPCVPELKPLCPSTMNVDGMNDKSLIQLVMKKRKTGDAPSKEDISETSGSKTISKSATKSTNRDDSYLEESCKSKLKRTHTSGKKEVQSSERSELDEQLVGSRIKVWWPLDKMFYEGIVNSYDPVKKKHQVLYADGDEEVLNLKKECWELVGDNVLPGGQEPNDREPCASSDLLQKRRRKAKSDKREMVDSSSKRSRASGGISEVIEQTKSGDNFADNLEPDIPNVVSKSVDDHPSMAEDGLKDDDRIKSPDKSRIERPNTSMAEDGLKDNDHIKSTGKSRIERPNTGTSLMQNMLKTTTLPKGFL